MKKSLSEHKGPFPTMVNAKSSSVDGNKRHSKEEIFGVVRFAVTDKAVSQ